MAETALREMRRLRLWAPPRRSGETADGGLTPQQASQLAPRLAREWLAALGGCGRPARAGQAEEILGDEIAERILLTDLASRLVAILFATPFEPESAALAGRALVTAGFTGADVLGRSLRVLMLWLPAALGGGAAVPSVPVGRRRADDMGFRVAEVAGAFVDGYASALRDRAVAETESLRRAELDAERVLSRQLRHQATHDPLTGLPNRAELFARLSAVLSGGGGGRVGLCYLDLDGFKAVNDSRGHAAGDELLIAIAGRFGRVAREHGAVAIRLGGDEFVILAGNSPGLTGMITLAASLLAEARRPVALSSGVISVSACAGVVDRLAVGTAAESVVAAADAALYAAKSRGADHWFAAC
jgi:diguanylate cyclase (GGDEF)-like protein